MFGSGPGALPSDARTMGVDPMLLRDRQDESLGVIRRLLSGEDRFTYECDWFTLRDAALQLLPVQRDMPMTVASSISPSGMQLAGKYGIGVLSIASNSTAGLQALPDPVGSRRGERGAARAAGRSGGVAGADGLAHRRGQGAGPAGGRRRAPPLAQRVQRPRPGPARARCGSRARGSCSNRWRSRGRTVPGAAVDRHPGRPRRRHPPPAGADRRFRRRARLRPRLGQPRGHHAQLGPGRPLRHPRARRLAATATRVGRLRAREPGASSSPERRPP